MTLNVGGLPNDIAIDYLLKFMKEAEVDIACLQEVGDFHSLPPGSEYKMMANPVGHCGHLQRYPKNGVNRKGR